MSLDVRVFTINSETGEADFPKDLPNHNTPVGGENCRTLLYGAAISSQLGLVLIPSLADRNLWVRNEQLATLKAEMEIMSQHLEEIAEQTKFKPHYVAENVRNISRAIEIAEGIGGGVVVW